MRSLSIHIRRFLAEDDGPTVCEYAILLALIVVVAVGAVRYLGETMQTLYGLVTESLNSSGPTDPA